MPPTRKEGPKKHLSAACVSLQHLPSPRQGRSPSQPAAGAAQELVAAAAGAWGPPESARALAAAQLGQPAVNSILSGL